MKEKMRMLLMLFLVISIGSYAQDNVVKNKIISKAYHFDKTPELRSMKAIAPHYRERAWKDMIIKNPSVEMSFENNQEGMLAPTYDPTLQMNDGSKQTRGPELSIQGIGNVNGVYPPDTDGDVGPDHYVQMINLSFAVWDKEGNLLYGPVDNSTLWQGFVGPWTGTNDGDPIVLYDDMADRWVASQFAVNVGNGKYYELVAVSATPDPMGEWYRYAFEYDVFVDYPKLGVWSDAYYMTTNNFNGGFVGIGAHAYEREAMLEGDPDAQMAYFELNSWVGFSMQPADCDGIAPPEGEPGVFVVKGDNNDLDVYEFSVDWENPDNTTFDLQYSIPVTYYNSNVWGITQPNTSQELDALSSMIMYRMQYRNMGDHQAMVLNHTVKSGGVAGIRWYELRKTDAQWELYQEGTYAPGDGLNRWMGSIAMNANGDIALGYTVSSADVYPSIRYTGRAAEDPLGEMTFGEVDAMPGSGSQTNISRWGDYSNTSVDPANDSVFWHTNEYMTNSWKTRVISFTFSPPKAPEVNAGPDTTICSNKIYDTQAATGKYFSSIYWETSGDGRFLPSGEVLHTDDMRGSGDIDNGQVTLSVYATGYGSTGQVADSMFLYIQDLPRAFAGVDTTVCNNDVVQLHGTIEKASSSEWTTEGDGYFDDPTSLNAIYYPGEEDIADGDVQLRLFAYAIAPCLESHNDKKKITFDNCVGQTEFNAEMLYSATPNPVTDMLNVSVLPQKKEVNIQIIDPRGKEVFISRLDAFESRTLFYDFKDLPAGIYILSVRSGDSVFNEKLIVK